LRALACIVEIVRKFDVLAVQEVKRDTSGLRQLARWLGPDWGLILTDVHPGDEGNSERLAFLFDRRRVTPSGLAGEIVLPPTRDGNPSVQFARAPYMVGFQAGEDRFVLMTAHIKYGKIPPERLPELTALAGYIAREIVARATAGASEETNLIVLGDFNIDERGGNPLFQAFISTGLSVPPQLEHLQTTLGTKPKFYDQIAWFMGQLNMRFNNAGVIHFGGATFPELSAMQVSHRISDHLPLWAEFIIDHSEEKLAVTLGVDPAMPDPLSVVPFHPIP
jgi:endonuclease/exonuclease/phosphatase family metal-dependent hydrolase